MEQGDDAGQQGEAGVVQLIASAAQVRGWLKSATGCGCNTLDVCACSRRKTAYRRTVSSSPAGGLPRPLEPSVAPRSGVRQATFWRAWEH
jgi:hypothetical protein